MHDRPADSADPPRDERSGAPLWRLAVLLAAFGVVWPLLDRLAIGLFMTPDGVTPWYPAAGLYVALFAAWGWRALPALLVSVAWVQAYPALGMGAERALLPTLWWYTQTGLVYGGAVWAMRRRGVDFALREARDLRAFLWALGALAPALLAVLQVAVLLAVGRAGLEDAPALWYAFWAGDATGIVALGIPLLFWLRSLPTPWRPAMGPPPQAEPPSTLPGFEGAGPNPAQGLLLEAAATLATVAAVVLLLPANALSYNVLLMVPVLWVALRHGLSRTTLILLVLNVSMVTTLAVERAVRGSISYDGTALLTSLLAVTFMGVVLALLTDERRRYASRAEAAEREAESVARFRSALLQNLNHEVRTPLTGVIGFAELLGERLEEPSTPEGRAEERQMAGYIERSGHRLMNTLDSMLELSQLDAGTRTLKQQTLDLRTYAAQAAAGYAAAAEAKRLALDVHVPDEPVWVYADEEALNRILDHLVGNAVKFTASGSVTVTVTTTVARGLVRVEDTGVGMAPEAVESMLAPFRQGSEGDARQFEGLGLGLPVAKRLLGLMSGILHVRSEPGVGTAIEAGLLKAAAAPPPPRVAPATTAWRQN